jgi:hypothetical protein
MEFEADPNQDGRLRLRRRVLWVEATGDLAGVDGPGHAWQLVWAVEGMAGAVSLNVDVGGFRSGHQQSTDAPPTGNQDIGREVLAKHWVEAGLAARGVYVHAFRPWPVSEDAQEEHARCPVLEERCWAQQLYGEHNPDLHHLLVQLVQPGGGEFVWERLEGIYREEFAPALSAAAYAARQREEGARLAEATRRGAELAARMSASVIPEAWGPPTELPATVAVTLPGPFQIDAQAWGAPEERWVTVVRAETNEEHGLCVWVAERDTSEPQLWELRSDRTVRIRGPL